MLCGAGFACACGLACSRFGVPEPPELAIKIISAISATPKIKAKILQQSVKERDFEVSSSYLVSCAPCHGDDGRGKIAPPIGGKSKDQILASLKDYKAGKIKNSLMSGLLTNVSDESLDALADEISKFKE